MRYYEGERVIIRKDLEDFDSVDYLVVDAMLKLRNQVATIMSSEFDGAINDWVYTIDLDDEKYDWSSDMFENETLFSTIPLPFNSDENILICTHEGYITNGRIYIVDENGDDTIDFSRIKKWKVER